MANIYLIQLVGVILTIVGVIALTASAGAFGTPLSREQKRRVGKNVSDNVYHVPINFASIASTLFFFGGIGILIWSKFNLCAFLAYWAPTLLEEIKMFLACS